MTNETLEIARKMIEDWKRWKKEQEQKLWEKDSLQSYEDSRVGHGDNDSQQRKSV